jgi:hypothetical protein
VLYAAGNETRQITEHVKINHTKCAKVRVKTHEAETTAGRTLARQKLGKGSLNNTRDFRLPP